MADEEDRRKRTKGPGVPLLPSDDGGAHRHSCMLTILEEVTRALLLLLTAQRLHLLI
jgi:hypothetical protein